MQVSGWQVPPPHTIGVPPPPQVVLAVHMPQLGVPPHPLVMVAQSDAIAPVSVQVARFIQSAEGLGGAIDVVGTEFDIEVRPYSLITVKNRVLSPAAKMLYDLILREVG